MKSLKWVNINKDKYHVLILVFNIFKVDFKTFKKVTVISNLSKK